MKRLMVVLVMGALALSACSSSTKSSQPASTTTTPTTAAPRKGWNAAALAAAKGVADKIRAGGVQCSQYTDLDFGFVSTDLTKSGIPVPGAQAQCTSAGGENLTFETFADQTAAYQFMGSKINRICTTAAETKQPAPQFPYVGATTYFVEPDSLGTAQRIAKILPNTRVYSNPCPA